MQVALFYVLVNSHSDGVPDLRHGHFAIGKRVKVNLAECILTSSSGSLLQENTVDAPFDPQRLQNALNSDRLLVLQFTEGCVTLDSNEHEGLLASMRVGTFNKTQQLVVPR